MITIKRSYEFVDQKSTGFVILVDRLWPRGIKKERLKIDIWDKELAPNTELRKWFAHDPEKWAEFKQKYFKELNDNSDVMADFLEIIKKHKNIILLYSAKDELHNNAIALKEYLEKLGIA